MIKKTKTEKYLIGIDEVGMGAWSGKVVICAVRAPIDWKIDGLRDSKKLSRENREALNLQLIDLFKTNQIQFSIQFSTNQEIDRFKLGDCHKTCVVKAINELYQNDDEIIMDGNLGKYNFVKHGLNENCNFRSVIKADDQFPQVQAASILAKQYRDAEMIELNKQYPEYNWKSNVGYISQEHKEAVRKFGLSELHRRSYKVSL